MIDFEFKGILVNATVAIARREFRDSGGRYLNRFDRSVNVTVHFWDFVIDNDLYELAMVKSTLSYFMQAYWKRSNKEGGRIDLAETLEHGKDSPQYGFDQKLAFVARQKNKRHSLEITLTNGDRAGGQIYLSGREVIMLDIAVGKAINLLAPETVCLEN